MFRHKKKAFSLSLAILCLTAAAVVYFPRTYGSEAKLFVRVGRENVTLDPTATQGQTIQVQKSHEREINSVMEILKSRVVAQRVVASVGVETILESGDGPQTSLQAAMAYVKDKIHQLDPISDEERAIVKVQKSTKIVAPKDTDVITISCKARSPQLAHAIVESVVETFLTEHIRVSRTRGSRPFFAQQVSQQKKLLEEASRELRDAKNRDGVVTIDGQRSLLLAKMGRVENDSIAAYVDLAYSKARVKDLRTTVDKLPETVVMEVESGIGHLSTDQMRQQLYTLEIQERHHSSRYTPEHPALKAVQDQRKKVEDIYEQQPVQRAHTTKGINASREQLRVQLLAEQATLAALRARTDALSEQHEQLEVDLKAMNDRESQLVHLQRKVDLADSKYRNYLGSLEQARVNEALERERISSINTIQSATLVEKPVSPRISLVIAFGLLLSVCGPLALVLTAEYFDHTFTTPTQVERQLGLPVLVSIPRTSSHRVSLN